MSNLISFSHPSLRLGGVADINILKLLQNIDAYQSKINAAQDKMNSLIAMKRSIAMTVNELADMKIDTTDIDKEISAVEKEIIKAATEYLNTRIANETAIQILKGRLLDTGSNADDQALTSGFLESPVDYSASTLINLPIASESIHLDSQFFKFGSSLENSALANIEKFVKSNSTLTNGQNNDLSRSVIDQVTNQYKNHGIAGTLIICASCTHKNTTIFSPLVIDPDKAIAAWNALNTEKITATTLKEATTTTTAETAQDETEGLHVVTGVQYGSSFVGMIHILKNDLSQSINHDELLNQLKNKLAQGGWLQNASGGIGVDSEALNQVKAILNSQTVSAHVSLVVMGGIPGLKSSTINNNLRQITSYDPSITTAVLSSANEQDSTTETLNSGAISSISSRKILEIQNSRVANIVKTIGSIDAEGDKSFGINSLMNAFESYINAIQTNENFSGIPISGHLKRLTRTQIIKLWREKYQLKEEESLNAANK